MPREYTLFVVVFFLKFLCISLNIRKKRLDLSRNVHTKCLKLAFRTLHILFLLLLGDAMSCELTSLVRPFFLFQWEFLYFFRVFFNNSPCQYLLWFSSTVSESASSCPRLYQVKIFLNLPICRNSV